MAGITASINPIIVNREAGNLSGATTITYLKDPGHDLWEIMIGGVGCRSMSTFGPGNHYFFAVFVVDAFANWDIKKEEFMTLQRKITVQFKTLRIYNDGDPYKSGDGEFWFRVSKGSGSGTQSVVDEFYMATQDIDDWNEHGRDFPLGYAHLGEFEIVTPGEEDVMASSWGLEHDGILEADENASGLNVYLPLPAGSSGRERNQSRAHDRLSPGDR